MQLRFAGGHDRILSTIRHLCNVVLELVCLLVCLFVCLLACLFVCLFYSCFVKGSLTMKVGVNSRETFKEKSFGKK